MVKVEFLTQQLKKSRKSLQALLAFWMLVHLVEDSRLKLYVNADPINFEVLLLISMTLNSN